jgi:TPP-dependent pyruvate/acetoin dehydrogenase alpha subunit
MNLGHNTMITGDHGLQLYRTMMIIRRFEEQAVRFVTEQKMPTSTHSSIGQEAVAAGVCSALQSGDQIFTTHRAHGHCLAMGVDLTGFMAELMLKNTGINSGRAGSMHVADPEHGVLGANGIVGGGVPMAVGAAYAAQARQSGQVIVAFFGDGASSQGACHEAMNLASLWKLPVLFVCEHNGYAEMTPSAMHVSASDLSSRAVGYGMPGVQLDGNDVIAVYEAAAEAVTRARSGGGPSFLVCRTYRIRGHFEGDPERYRPTGQKAEWLSRDPIGRLAAVLTEEFKVSQSTIDGIDGEATALVAEAARKGDAAPAATGEGITDYVYAKN